MNANLITQKRTEALKLSFNSHYERMAIQLIRSPSCEKESNSYAAKNAVAHREAIQRILNGEFAFNRIPGLQPTRRKAAVKMMATLVVAVEGREFCTIERFISLYNKHHTRERNPEIKLDLLFELYDGVLETRNEAFIMQWADENKTYLPLLTFYPAAVSMWGKEKSDEDVDFVYAALNYTETNTALERVRNGRVRHPALLECLRQSCAKDFFCSNSIDKIVAKKLEDYNYQVSNRNFYDKDDYPLGYRDRIMTGTMLMAELMTIAPDNDLLGQISFTKEQRKTIEFRAYACCEFDEDEFDYVEQLAQQYLDDYDSMDKEQLYEMELIFKDYNTALYSLVLLYTYNTLLKQSIIRELKEEFFKPRDEEAAKQVRAMQNRAERTEKELETKANELKSAKAHADAALRRADEARNKVAGHQSKIKTQEDELRALKKRMAELEKENGALKQALAEQKAKEAEQQEFEQQMAAVTPEVDYSVLLAPVFREKKIVFVGGNENIMSKFATRNPDAVVITKCKNPSTDAQMENADAILMKTDSMGHSEFYKAKGIAVSRKIPYNYLHSFANVQLFEKDVYEILSGMEMTAGEGARPNP